MKVFKRIYQWLPAKKLIFSGLRLIWKPSRSIYQHLHFTGIFSVPVRGTKRRFQVQHYGYQIENSIFWQGLEGGHEGTTLKLWSILCKNSKTILDIGASTGIFSLVAKTVAPDSKVYAFEPVERVFDKLKVNCDLNQFEVSLIKKAASNFDGLAKIYDLETEHIYSVTVNKDLGPEGYTRRIVEIPTVTLKTFIEEEKLSEIDLIKIDVETHEVEVIQGMAEYLSKMRPTLFIEVLTQEVAEGLRTLFENLGYVFFDIDESGAIQALPQIERSTHYNLLVCQPQVAKDLSLHLLQGIQRGKTDVVTSSRIFELEDHGAGLALENFKFEEFVLDDYALVSDDRNIEGSQPPILQKERVSPDDRHIPAQH